MGLKEGTVLIHWCSDWDYFFPVTLFIFFLPLPPDPTENDYLSFLLTKEQIQFVKRYVLFFVYE